MKQLLGKARGSERLSQVEFKKLLFISVNSTRNFTLNNCFKFLPLPQGRFKIPTLDTSYFETFSNGSLSISYSFWLFPESFKKIIIIAYKHLAIMHTKR